MKSWGPFVFAMVMSGSFAGAAWATPAEGTRELRLQNRFLAPYVSLPFGFTLGSDDGSGESDTSIFVIGAGLGYFVKDAVEIGASLSYMSLEQGIELSGVSIDPFARAYKMLLPTLGGYVEGMVGFSRISSGDDATVVKSVGIELGIEIFLADSWALRIAPSYRHLSFSVEAGETPGDMNVFGVNYGFAAYY